MNNIYEIFSSAIKAVNPYNCLKSYCEKIAYNYKNMDFNKLFVICFGKAAYSMFLVISENLGNLITKCIAITKYGHVPINNKTIFKFIKPEFFILYEAGHPIPDENGLRGTEEIIRLLENADENTLVLCLISGGGSSILVSPYEGILLEDKQKITQLVLKAGADIYELNTIRKHISKVKGGKLAEIAYPARIISLILSDVIGDKLDVIASGPTAPDKTTFNDALRVLEKYRLIDKAPESIIKLIRKGVEGFINETPKEKSRIFQNVENIIIGSNRIALNAAKQKAEEIGFHTEIISSELIGEARNAGKWLAKEVRKRLNSKAQKHKKPLCLISGGETTVNVKGEGVGGRNMELALAFAIEIEDLNRITLLSAGTDGTDGPTNAAGAIVNSRSIKKAKALGLNPTEYLNNNDSYNFFEKTGELFITGPTGTNVMDIQIILVE